jgi:hypothetical protein
MGMPVSGSIELNALRGVLATFSVLFAQGIFSGPSLFQLALPLPVLPIGFDDGQLKRVPVITFNFVDGRSI